jgi:hypothetical protein
MTLISHMTFASFKPMNLFKVITHTQEIEIPVKPSQQQIADAFARAA